MVDDALRKNISLDNGISIQGEEVKEEHGRTKEGELKGTAEQRSKPWSCVFYMRCTHSKLLCGD